MSLEVKQSHTTYLPSYLRTYYGNWPAHLQEVYKIEQHESVELRQFVDQSHARVVILAAIYRRRVHLTWDHRLAQFTEPQLEQ